MDSGTILLIFVAVAFAFGAYFLWQMLKGFSQPAPFNPLSWLKLP